MSKEAKLSRREREIMDVIYRAGRATAAEVLAQLTDPPSYSAVRALLRVLEDKGHLRHEEDGPRHVFLPTVPRERARPAALRQILHQFFHGSARGGGAAGCVSPPRRPGGAAAPVRASPDTPYVLRRLDRAGRRRVTRSPIHPALRCGARTPEPAHCRRAYGGPLT